MINSTNDEESSSDYSSISSVSSYEEDDSIKRNNKTNKEESIDNIENNDNIEDDIVDNEDQNTENNNNNTGKKDKSNKHQTKLQIKCEKLRNLIEYKNLKNHLSYIDRELKLKRKRELLKIEDEIEHYDIHMKRKKVNNQIDLISAKINFKKKQLEWDDWIDREPEYLRNPVQKTADNKIEIILSNRIIHLNGAITYNTAEYIADRIHYYNNQNPKLPIFLIIDSSPGGSVMAGYRILKTIESSSSKVYVILISYAASMAATIVTLAKYSYVFQNAIIMHHQIWSRSVGNLVKHREKVNELEEWWKRLATPLIKKLKVESLEKWIELMYQNNSEGDWSLFGDDAVKLGWATGIVDYIKETGNIKHPDSKKSDISSNFWFHNNKIGINNISETFILPELRPFDYYWIHDPYQKYKLFKN